MILITGANGWLGLNLVEAICKGKTEKWGLKKDKIRAFILKGSPQDKLRNISNDIEIIEGDIINKKDLEYFMSSSNDSYLFHTVGVIHPKRIKDFYIVNRDGTSNLLEIASMGSIKRVIIMSSNSPIGCNPNNQHKFDESSPYNPYMNYGRSKMEMELIAKEYFSNNRIDLTLIRSPWFYGPYQPARQKIFFEMIMEGKVPILGDGNNHRSMAYTENIVQGMVLAAINSIASGKIYWIADSEPYSMNNIIETIESLLENKFGMECDHGRMRLPSIIGTISEKIDLYLQKIGIYNQKIHVLSEMNKNISCSVELAKQELGYNPEFSIQNGMLKSLEEIYSK